MIEFIMWNFDLENKPQACGMVYGGKIVRSCFDMISEGVMYDL